MKRNLKDLIHGPRKLAGMLTLLCISLCMVTDGALADWQAPVMNDYVKVPVFASYTAKPNIMIALDNSGSMNNLAYSDGYTGTPYNGTSKSFPVLLDRDDMEEDSSGVLRDGTGSGNDLDFGTDFIGIRFQAVSIPQGATITSARIEMTSKYNFTSITTDLEILGEASDDAAFLDVTDNNNISNRHTTTASVSWSPGDWVSSATYDTPDLTAIVQEIVDRGGWVSGNAMLFRLNNPGFPTTQSGHREAFSREAGQNVAPVLHVTYIDQVAGTRYYGYFNPDYFYKHSSNVFWPTYKKVKYDPFTKSWTVQSLSGGTQTISDTDIAPSVKSNGLWDGNWMNWLSMRRVDVLRKVLMGGKATSRTGGGNQQNQAESAVDSGYGPFYKYFNSTTGPATSPYKGGFTYQITNDGAVMVSSTKYTIDIQKYISIEPEDFYEGNLAGIMQRIGDRARWGNMWFNEGSGTNKSGGSVQNTIDNEFSTNFLPDLQSQKCNTWTPLAETMYVASQYFAQEEVESNLDYPNQAQLFGIGKNTLKDPYWDKKEARSVPCAKSFVLLLTDGASTKDAKIPSGLKDFDKDSKDKTGCSESSDSNCDYPSGGTDFLDDVALYARTTDLRPDLEGDQNMYLYTVFAFDDDPNARSLLKDAARNGGFNDLNGDGKPNGTYTDSADQRLEWDQDGDGNPDTYYEASDGYTLQEQLLAAINDILKRASSGTAASVVSNSRSGEGAVYQSIFFPATTAGSNSVKWVGQVHALFSDAYGNLREDTNHNKKLDLNDDLFIVFGDETLQKYKDINGDSIFDSTDEAQGPVTINGKDEFGINEINYLWCSNTWLNEMTDPVNQRSYYGSTAQQRYIFTFVDANGDMAATGDEVKPFVSTTDPAWADVIDPNNFYAYIHAFKPYTPPIPATDSDFKSMVSHQIHRVIDFTRGEDQPFETIGSVYLPAFRNRQIDYDGDGTVETWRLGDIVYSTPTIVSQPAEDFDLLYHDKGYSAFFRRYQNRRNVIYVGSNDGMIHAFNGGFFDSENNAFVTKPVDGVGNEITEGGPYHEFDIGAELWSYVPYNLLPHLYWLTDPAYDHICYNDLQPRIFDARIYPSKGENDPTNPNGWATVMVTGMRFGGGKIAADIDKSDGAYNSDVDRAMSSAYAIFDITNPEEPPVLLGEIKFPELGFTTCHPGVIPMRNFDTDHQEKTNQWYLIFGSGPTTADGATTEALTDGTSSQQGVLYAIDLVELAENHKVVTLTGTGAATYNPAAASNPYYLVRFSENKSFVSKPITVDWNLDGNSDASYFGLVYGDPTTGWNGKLRRLVMENGSDPTVPANWTLDSTLLDLSDGVSSNLANGQPIVASATAAVDNADDRWLFYGTGRFYAQADKEDFSQQSYYGIKEPYTEEDNIKKFTYGPVDFDHLMDVTNIIVYKDGTSLDGFSGSFQDLADYIENEKAGWRLSLDASTGERNLGEAVLAGDVLTFTTYLPSDEPCNSSGQSMVYALYYRTGTSYFKSIIGLDDTIKKDNNALVIKSTSLGKGMTLTPNIHVGRGHGTEAYIQGSTGAIHKLDTDNPGTVKSGRLPNPPGDQTCP